MAEGSAPVFLHTFSWKNRRRQTDNTGWQPEAPLALAESPANVLLNTSSWKDRQRQTDTGWQPENNSGTDGEPSSRLPKRFFWEEHSGEQTSKRTEQTMLRIEGRDGLS